MVKVKVLLAGSVLAAIAASLCCLGPLVAVVLGLGAFGASAAFEAVRPYLLGLTGVLLAGGFYLVYRKREIKCEDSSCQVRGVSRGGKVLLWLATVAVLAFAAFPYYSGALLRASTKKGDSAAPEATSVGGTPAEMKLASVVIGVKGMTCASCAATVRLALERVGGVRAADVSLEKKETTVSYNPNVATVDQLKAAINETGYKAERVSDSSGQ